jgi:cation transport protein ChaC
MWRPGFDYVSRLEAHLHGYHRAFCVYSHVHRGTPERPGLVLGLDRGGSCRGVAYRVTPESWADVFSYLQAREQATAIYLDRFLPIRFLGKNSHAVTALCFTVDRAHHQYAGRLSIETQAKIVLHGVGQSGRNPEYLENTVAHLKEMGLHDANLFAVRDRMRQMEQGAV